MKNILLDTNILIHLNRGKEIAKKVRDFVNTLSEPQVFISVVNIAEAESLVVQWKMPEEAVNRLRMETEFKPDGELQIIHENGQPYGIRDKGGTKIVTKI